MQEIQHIPQKDFCMMVLNHKQLTLLLMFLGTDLLAISIFDNFVFDIWGCAICYILALTGWLYHTVSRKKGGKQIEDHMKRISEISKETIPS